MSERSVVIAGTGQVCPVAEDNRSIAEMVLEAVESALSDAGIDHNDIDSVVTASVDIIDGLTASNIAVTEVVGAVMKPETRIAADGLCAAIHAACQIWSGAYDTVLVVAHAKTSMAPFQDLMQWAMDPIYLQPLGVDFLTCAGLQAQLIAAGDPGAERRWAEIAARRINAVSDNLSLTEDDILSSPILASPLRRDMCAPMGDSACAVVLRADTDNKDGRPRISGIGHDLEPHGLGDRDLRSWSGLKRASNRAYTMAGIDDPATAFEVVEPSCLYPHEEQLFLAAAGLDEKANLSLSGGLFSGHAPIVAGLSRLATASKAIEGIDGKALAHGTWGPAGQGQAVIILEGAGA